MIELKKITKDYILGEQVINVLKGIDLIVNQGEFVSIMGPSGSGKSTLMNIIGLLDKPTTGEYRLDGIRVDSFKESEKSDIRGQKIGFVFQTYNLVSRMSAIKQVMLPLRYQGVRRTEMKKRAVAAMEKVGVGDRIESMPNELSGGQQQRVAIARALVINPSLILADEPTGALDTITGKQVMDILIDLNKEGKTIVIITHEKEVADYAKRHIFIRDGEIVND